MEPKQRNKLLAAPLQDGSTSRPVSLFSKNHSSVHVFADLSIKVTPETGDFRQ